MEHKFEYEFKTKFQVAKNGEQDLAEKIEVMAPNNVVIKYVTILDEEMTKAMFALGEKADKSDSNQKNENEVSAAELIAALAGGGANLNKCIEALRSILIHQAKINDSIPVTDFLFKKMSYIDTKNILGDYLKFFLSSSLLS